MKENRDEVFCTPADDGGKKPAAKKTAPQALVFNISDGDKKPAAQTPAKSAQKKAPLTPKGKSTVPKTPSRSSKRIRGEKP